MILQFDVYDNSMDTVKWMIDKVGKDGVRKALKSTGWFAMTQIKAGIESGAPGGQRYHPFMSPKIRRALDQVLHGRGKSKYPPMGRLKPAVKYNYMASSSRGMSVVVGWNSRSASFLGGMQQTGAVRPMSEKFRAALNAAFDKAGLKIRVKDTTKTVKLPRRDTIPAMHRALQSKIGAHFESKLREYLKTGLPPSSVGKKRVYKIY